MISKAEFIAAMEELRSLEQGFERVDDALRQLDPDFGGFSMPRVSEFAIGLLSTVMADKGDWISYYIYELDWGSKWHSGQVTERDGRDIPLGTLADLYDMLMQAS